MNSVTILVCSKVSQPMLAWITSCIWALDLIHGVNRRKYLHIKIVTLFPLPCALGNKCVHECGDFGPAFGKCYEKWVQRTAFAVCLPPSTNRNLVPVTAGLAAKFESYCTKFAFVSSFVLAWGRGSHPPHWSGENFYVVHLRQAPISQSKESAS